MVPPSTNLPVSLLLSQVVFPSSVSLNHSMGFFCLFVSLVHFLGHTRWCSGLIPGGSRSTLCRPCRCPAFKASTSSPWCPQLHHPQNPSRPSQFCFLVPHAAQSLQLGCRICSLVSLGPHSDLCFPLPSSPSSSSPFLSQSGGPTLP